MTGQTVQASEQAHSRKDILAMFGAFSGIMTFVAFFVLSLILGADYGRIISDIYDLLIGNYHVVERVQVGNLRYVVADIMALVPLKIVASLTVNFLVNRNSKSYDIKALESMLAQGVLVTFLIVAGEEIITRGLLLGLLANWIGGSVAFYAFFIGGNLLWALIHLSNFDDKDEWSILRVLPQFVGGVFLTYFYLKYGLLWTVLAHFTYNTVIFATMKKDMPGVSEFFSFVYYGVLGLIAAIVLWQSPANMSDLASWVTSNPVVPQGWSFWSYVWAFLLIDSVFVIASVIFVFDIIKTDDDALDKAIDVIQKYRLLGFGLMAFFLGILKMVLILGLTTLIGLFTENALMVALTVALVSFVVQGSYSGSSLARATFVHLPATFLSVVAYLTLPFWYAVALIMISYAVHFLPSVWNSEALNPD